tara:strand:- start:7626 stop:8615 length:990 start_codon:yes stop_codon:yes gene_type:complete
MKYLITGGSGFIGTNLISFLQKKYPSCSILNIDTSSPRNVNQSRYWIDCDIMDFDKLLNEFKNFDPSYVVNLAAKASLDGKTAEHFPENITGAKNVAACVRKMNSILKFLHFSTQYVIKPGVEIKGDYFYKPYTPYGESKAIGEKIVRDMGIECDWLILRPTNIWGPWHSFFPFELWKYLSKRYYVHPGFEPINKYYGYIGNIVRQINSFLKKKHNLSSKKVFYLTDPPIDNYEWMNGFSNILSGKKVRRLPKVIWKTTALIGDGLKAVGVKSPIDSGRYFRLTVNENIPYEDTIEFVGNSKFDIKQGLEISLEWIKQYHSSLIKKQND